MNSEQFTNEVIEIKERLVAVESEIKSLNELKGDVAFIKGMSMKRDEQFQEISFYVKRIEKFLTGDFGAEGLIQQFNETKDKVDKHDKKILVFSTYLMAIFYILTNIQSIVAFIHK